MSDASSTLRPGMDATLVEGHLEPRAGIGLRSAHYRDLVERRPPLAFVEVHAENYFGAGGAPLHYLERAAAHYPLSLHGVGLSIGGADPLARDHLTALRALVERFAPALVSEHLCWGAIDGVHFNDLLPLPYTEEALAHVVARIGQVQEFLGRRILIENVSSYLCYEHSTIDEWEFLAEVADRADCGILLDINNVYVSAVNHGFDATAYLAAIPAGRVAEIHLAGHTRNELAEGSILIDTHDAPVCDEVWALYAGCIERLGARPTLIEWDTDLPALDVLLKEAARADRVLEQGHARVA